MIRAWIHYTCLHDSDQHRSSIDAEIVRLQQVRNLIAGADISSLAPKKTTGKRVMSAKAREKIAAAQRKRWAKQKKAKK
jgi:hypothetical protein